VTTLTNRAFGIELEVQLSGGQTRSSIARAITAAGVTCHEQAYGHTTPRNWKVVDDASISGYGAEIVSPKFYGEDGIRQARIVADALVAAGCKVNVSCGFHVHIDASDLNADQMARVAVNFMWFETFFDHIMPPSRRGSHNRYVNSNRSRFGGYGTAALNRGIARVTADRASIANVIYGLNGADRYYKLNLTAYDRHQMVEFRQHSGTVEADKIEHWVRLLNAFVEKSRVSRPRPRTVTRDYTAAEEMALFFSVFSVPAATKTYYQTRRAELARADREKAAAERREQEARRARLANAA
jgi:stress-induced morphogen